MPIPETGHVGIAPSESSLSSRTCDDLRLCGTPIFLHPLHVYNTDPTFQTRAENNGKKSLYCHLPVYAIHIQINKFWYIQAV